MFEIFTDSTANLSQKIIRKYRIKVMPFTYSLNGVEIPCYEQGKNFDYSSFYESLRSKVPLKTSMINMQTFISTFEQYFKRGVNILYIGFSSALSGTFNAAKNAIDELKEKYHTSKAMCIDTMSGSYGQGLMCYYAAKMRENDCDLEQTYARVSSLIPHLQSRFTCDDLFYIKRGGRISASTALAGTVMGIKPIMKTDASGKIVMYEKIRGRRKAIDKIVDELTRTVDMSKKQIVSVSHADCKGDADYLVSALKKLPYISDVLVEQMEPVTAIHGGPGMLALFYISRDERK